jgi:hypothetical protein
MLDYGAGTGHWSLALKKSLDIRNVVAADISDKGFDRGLLEQNGIKTTLASRPSEIDGVYDLILCWGVFHHISPKLYKSFLMQFSNLLADSGLLIIAGWSSRDEYFSKRKGVDSLYSGLPVYSLESLEYGKTFKSVGFDIAGEGKINISFDNRYKKEMQITERVLQYYFLTKNK